VEAVARIELATSGNKPDRCAAWRRHKEAGTYDEDQDDAAALRMTPAGFPRDRCRHGRC